MTALFALLPALALAAAPITVSTAVVDGEVSDALAGPQQQLLLTLAGPTRGVVPLTSKGGGALLRAPKGAISVAACASGGRELIFSTADGLVDDKGQLKLRGQALFVLPDDEHFYVAQLCGDEEATRSELRLVVREGLRVGHLEPSGQASKARTLRWRHSGRTYSGRVHRGMRPARPYGAASSVYAPHLVDADVDKSGTLDLIAQHEGRLAVFLRSANGELSTAPATEVDLYAKSGGPGGDLRVHIGDLDDDGRADAVIGRAEGPLPERSTAWWLRSSGGGLLNESQQLWDDEGLVAPLAVLRRARDRRDPHTGPFVLATSLDTSLVTLGGVVLSGELDMPLKLRRVLADSGRRTPSVRTVTAPGPKVGIQLNIRRMQTQGALPLAGVDLDADGLTDLLDLGTPGQARVWRGTRQGFTDEPEVFSVPPFVHVVPLPSLNAVVLVGAPTGGKTRVTWLRAAGR